MARGPAEVSFPGDKNRKRKVRVRGIKKASKEIQQRLDKNLETLLEDPESFLPEFRCELGKPRRDMVAMTLRNVDYVSQKRHDRRWLSKRMVKRRGDIVCKSLAGSLLAAGEEDTSTVSVYNSPIYGASSFIRRGNGKQSHMVGIQNFTHSKLRLLVWDDHAKAGHWFFSWDGGFVCSGMEAKAPEEWIESSLKNSSVTFNGDDVRWSKGLEKEIVVNEQITDSGWLKLDFGNVVVGLCSSSLSKTNDEPFVPSIALGMMPPKLSAVVDAEWMWRPKGWPEELELPEEGKERLNEVIQAWMNLAVPDDKIARACKNAILGSIEEGFITGNYWFADDSRDELLAHLQGTDDERKALAVILDSFESGVYVRRDGVVLDSENDVIRFDDSSCHSILIALWEKYGLEVLEELFGITDEEASMILNRQIKRKQGFGAFLRELGENLSTSKRLDRLPWESDSLPSPLNFAETLVRSAVENGIASTVSKARKGKGLDMAMGWAWLNVHNRTESDAWRFDESSRDKGGDWVPALQALWDAAEDLLLKDNLDAIEDYKAAMGWLTEVTGVQV
ncbi:MAG TPA: hypothetical protein QF508_03035 [Candidatus Thalassarchaeaceae archaeon]|nr:hypothetical protein [Candidatus Thalassarchaeaceae archaeon]MDP7658364.1 hypothetical protein [Candidatus Thalassarchaeaceae archaeon]HJO42361.1 hypothetical protein [Candidatus Thalassarchaeaceae archaeon]|tara:strand:- start:615 stop:2303 length:1689 start_codon:yes stop_codon:yes gene_type:complete